MTPRQRQVLDIVRHALETEGRAPTFDNICSLTGLKSRSNAHRVVHALIRQGRLVQIGYGSWRRLALPGTVDLTSVATSQLIEELRRRGAAARHG